MSMRMRIKDKFNLLACNAFFTALETQGAPWADDNNTGQASNLAYLYYAHSRNKIVASMVAESNSAMSAYAEIILQMYKTKWDKLYDLFTAEYNPIENYNMVESGENENVKSGSLDRSGAITRTGSESVSDDVEYKGKESNTRTGNIEDSGVKADNQSDTDTKLYGYNSSIGVNSDSSTQQASHKNTQTFNNLKDERSFTSRSDERDITTTYNSVADTDTRKDTYNDITDAGSHSLTRSGNIGVTTTQQMMEQELEVRKNLFFETVFSDIDHILTIPIY